MGLRHSKSQRLSSDIKHVEKVDDFVKKRNQVKKKVELEISSFPQAFELPKSSPTIRTGSNPTPSSNISPPNPSDSPISSPLNLSSPCLYDLDSIPPETSLLSWQPSPTASKVQQELWILHAQKEAERRKEEARLREGEQGKKDETFRIFVSTKFDLSNVPEEILELIFSFLPFRSLAHCSKVCKKFFK